MQKGAGFLETWVSLNQKILCKKTVESGRFVLQTEILGKYIVLVLISLLFYFFSSLRRGD